MDVDYKLIGRRIAMIRREQGLKQSEVEERAEIGYKYLSNIERGVSIPSLDVILRLAAALRTTPDHLLVGAYPVEPDAEDRALWCVFCQLDKEKKATAKSFLQWLSQQ